MTPLLIIGCIVVAIAATAIVMTTVANRREAALKRGKVCIKRLQAQEIGHVWGVDPAFSPYEKEGDVLATGWFVDDSEAAKEFASTHEKTEGCYEVRVTTLETKWVDPSEVSRYT